jgi:signal transduction histidine kinase
MARIDLRAVALQACEAGRELHSGTAIRSSVPDGPVMIDGDERLLVRLLSVLIDNAARHGASADGVELAIAATPDGPVVLTISDRGPGFTDDLRARAGEYFARSDASRNRHFGGTGLGLVLASRIAAAHRATLDLGNRHGGGAEVRIVFGSGRVAGGGVAPLIIRSWRPGMKLPDGTASREDR